MDRILCQRAFVFSHRALAYTGDTFPEQMHSHSYYKLAVYLGGSVRYICESKTLVPEYGSVFFSPPHTIGDACYQSGFRNMTSFLRVFTQIVGVSPSQYRRNFSGAQYPVGR